MDHGLPTLFRWKSNGIRRKALGRKPLRSQNTSRRVSHPIARSGEHPMQPERSERLFIWLAGSIVAFRRVVVLPGLKRTRSDAFFLLLAASVCFVYFFYFFQDDCYGPRFLYETAPFWILLSARGIEEIRRRWGTIQSTPTPKIQGALYGFLIVFFAAAAITSWPERIVSVQKRLLGNESGISPIIKNRDIRTQRDYFR